MENASKALLIAAAILIVILLIAVGMKVFNSASDTIGEGTEQMGSQAVSMFNAQFEPYIGNGVTASNAKSLISAVKANNGKNTRDVTLDTTSDGIADISGISDGEKYNITIPDTDGYDSGYISLIRIEKVSN